MNKRMVFGVALCCGVLGISACSSSRSHVTVQESTSLSKGRELSDLQRALNEGAITDHEYESVRRILLKRPY